MSLNETEVTIPGLGDIQDDVKDGDNQYNRATGSSEGRAKNFFQTRTSDFSDARPKSFSQATDFSEDVAEEEEFWGEGSGSDIKKDIIQDMQEKSFPEIAMRPKPPPFVPTKEYLERLETLKAEHSIERGPYVNAIGETDENRFTYFCKFCQCRLPNMGIVEAHIIGQRHIKSLQKFVTLPPGGPVVATKGKEGTPYISQMQKLTEKIKRPLVGLGEVIEYQNSENPKALPIYSCLICKTSHTYDKLLSHIEGTKHQMFFLKTHDDPSFPGLARCTQTKLRFQLNKKLNALDYGLKEKMQLRSISGNEFNTRKAKTEALCRKRTAQEELFLPTKKIKANNMDTSFDSSDGQQNQYQGQQKNQYQGQQKNQYQGKQKNQYQGQQRNQYQGQQKNQYQVQQQNQYQGPHNPGGFQGPRNQMMFNTPQQQYAPRGGRGPILGGPLPPPGNAPYYDPQGPSGGNVTAVTPYSGGGSLTNHDREFLQSLSNRVIQTDDDAQLLMNTVNSLTQNLVQYKIRKMPPQLKETLLMAARWGGSDALANLMEVTGNSSQNN